MTSVTSDEVAKYAKNEGNMVGVVELLLRFGPPPTQALSDAINLTLYMGHRRSQSAYGAAYVKYIAAPSVDVASMLLDYIAENNMINSQIYHTAVVWVKELIDSKPFTPERLELLVTKMPLLKTADWRRPKAFWAARSVAWWFLTPYEIAIMNVEKQDKGEAVRTLLKLGFPTTLPEDQDRTIHRYATITAAIDENCTILGILKDGGAEFPSLNAEEMQQLREAIKRRRQEKQKGSERESAAAEPPCNMEEIVAMFAAGNPG